jgi:chemotaxis protein CheC
MSTTTSRVAATLGEVATDGALRAERGLSGLVGEEIRIDVPQVRVGTKVDACDAVGGPDAIVLGAYLGITGDITGHVMLLFPQARAMACVDLMCGQPVGTSVEPDDFTSSAIGELANIVGSAFVNALADRAGLILHPSPPTVVHDMAIALVESVYAAILAQGGEVVMIDTVFSDEKGTTSGLLIVAPDSEAFARLAELAA